MLPPEYNYQCYQNALKINNQKITIIGGGYVGLSTAAYFLSKPYVDQVEIIELDSIKRSKILSAELPIYEPGLDEYFKKYKSKLKVKESVYLMDKSTDFVFICVGTPDNKDGTCDLLFISEAFNELSKLKIPLNVVIKSTVPPKTADNFQFQYPEFTILSNPEFLREGCAVQDIENMKRIVIGGPSYEKMVPFVSLYLRNHTLDELHITNNRTAELMKLASNYMLATRINAINTIASISDLIKGNIKEIENFLKTDPRLGNQYMSASIGFGGSCFPKDIKNLSTYIRNVKEKHYPQISDQIRDQFRLNWLQTKLLEPFPATENSKVGFLGTAFKEDTDDVREAASLRVANVLLGMGHKIHHYDPHSSHNFENQFKGFLMEGALIKHANSNTLFNNIDTLYIFNKNKECIEAIKNIPSNIKTIYDCVNLFEKPPKNVNYHSVGFYETFAEE